MSKRLDARIYSWTAWNSSLFSVIDSVGDPFNSMCARGLQSLFNTGLKSNSGIFTLINGQIVPTNLMR